MKGSKSNMEKQKLNRFVGIPYKYLGTDFTGVDCIGLCQLFFCEHGIPMVWRDGRPIEKDWYVKEPFRIVRWLEKRFNRIKNVDLLQYGDVVLYEINGEGHTGIYVGNHQVLTVLEQYKKSMIAKLHNGNFFFRSGYRLKEGED